MRHLTAGEASPQHAGQRDVDGVATGARYFVAALNARNVGADNPERFHQFTACMKVEESQVWLTPRTARFAMD
jgi:hypothetical protein